MQEEDQSTSGMWILVIFGTLGFLFVACIVAVGVAECVNSLTHCRHSSQRELGRFFILIFMAQNLYSLQCFTFKMYHKNE